MSLNTDPKVARRITFDFTHHELLTPALIYIWNAEPDELEQLADEIIGRMAPDFIGRYLSEDISTYKNMLFLLSNAHLLAAFRELISRADHGQLRNMDAYVQLVMEAPCKSDECREDCNEYYREEQDNG